MDLLPGAVDDPARNRLNCYPAAALAVSDCLRWYLTYPDETRIGVYTATTPASATSCARGSPHAWGPTGRVIARSGAGRTAPTS